MSPWLMTVAALLVPGAALAQIPPGLFGSPYQFTEQGGEAIYRGVCAGCHMPDGQGAVGAGTYPALAQDTRLADSAYAVGIVLHGQNAMPGFAHTLSDRRIADVVGFIRTNFGNRYPDEATEADVKRARE